ncbi:MAG TPA: hypothetical protein VK465_07735 [Fibrobacteria bacterium]|nr:hypothetical protein [Fibrobacteria bacterium]
MKSLRRILYAGLSCLLVQVTSAALKPLFHDNLNASYDFAVDVSSKSANTDFVDFSAQYPAAYNADLILEGANLHMGGESGPVSDIPAFRVKSHTSKAINVRALEDNDTAHVEFRFASGPQAVHATDLLLLLEGFNLTEQIEDHKMTIEVFLVDPFSILPPKTDTLVWRIIDYVRAFRAGQFGNNPPVLQRTATPPNCYPLQLTQPFMDLQTHRFTEEDLKFRVDRVRISVPRLKTVAQISGLPNPVVVNGGIRVHGVAISTGFYFGSYTEAEPYQTDGPWFSQANPNFATWRQEPVNSNVPVTDESIFRNAGCWVSSWATTMHAQGATKVEDFNSTQLVNLTPLTLARYAQKLGLFKNGNTETSLPSYNLPDLLKQLNTISGNTRLEYKDQLINDVNPIEDYLSRKIPVVLKVVGHDHFVVANGMETVKYQNSWVKTYRINDVGFTHNIRLVKSLNSNADWQNQFEYALVMSSSDKSIPNSLAIEIFSPAYAFVTDPLGRRRGLNPLDGIFYDEIPKVTEALGDPAKTILPFSGLPQDLDREKYLHINQPMDGQYQILVVGTGSGDYTLKITKVNAFGVATEQVSHGSTSKGQVDPFTVAYTDASGDVVPPITVADYEDVGWNRINPLTIRFSATDDGSGVVQTLVSLNGATPSPLNPLLLGEEGPHQVEFWSLDAAGNEEMHKSLIVRNDFSAPITSHNYSGTGSESGPVSIQFQASDNLSGVGESFLTLNGVPQSGLGSVILSDPGHYDLEFYSIDIAGNVEERKDLEISIQAGGDPIRHLMAKAKGTEVSLKWTPNGAPEYAVLRSTQGPNTGFVEIARTSERKFEDMGLSIGVTYYYKVVAGSSQSEVVSATVPGGR